MCSQAAYQPQKLQRYIHPPTRRERTYIIEKNCEVAERSYQI